MKYYYFKPRYWFCGVGCALKSVLVIFGLALGQALGQAQPVKVGEVSDDFEITNRETGEPLKLSDYEGHVVVLDFFAWWCGPCRTSSPDVEKNIAQYFHDRDGNEHGVPVTVIGINIEEDSPDRTDQFVTDSGMELVADDFDSVAWNMLNERSAIPLFAIINGVEGNEDYKQWEVVYKKAGYEGADKFRSVINKIKPGFTKPTILKKLDDQSVPSGGTAVFEVQVDDESSLIYQWKFNGELILGATGPKFLKTGVTSKDQGVYSVIITNEHNLSAEDSAELLILDSAPSILIQPMDLTVEAGNYAKIFANAIGSKPLTYQWFLNDDPIRGETEDVLSFSNVWIENVGDIWVEIENDFGKVISNKVELKLTETMDISYNDALDTEDMIFLSSPNFKWNYQTKENSDGEDALVMTGLPDWDGNLNYATLKTLVNGPGNLEFNVKIDGDLQIFRAFIGQGSVWDKDFITITDTSIDWNEYNIEIPDGSHIVTFMFLQGPKNGGNDSSLWLDAVNFTPEDQTNSEIKLVLSEVRNGKLILNFNAASGIKYKLERSENLIEWKLYRELKPEQAEATIEVPMTTDGFGQFYRLKSE